MPRRTRLLNKKLYVFTFLLFVFYALVAAMSGYYTYSDYVKYGLYYTATIQTAFTSNFFINASVTVLMLVTALVLLICSSQNVIAVDYDPKASDSSSYGIEFPNGRPEHWDISANMETRNLEITLETATVTISKETIDNLFMGKVVKKN